MILKNIQQLLQGNYRMSVKNIVSKLSTTEKIELYNCLYTDLSGEGIGGDTELAHVNIEEMQVLRDMGGSGTVNPNTGLIQFMGGSPGGGGGGPAPSSNTQTVKETIPDELKPFVTDVLEKSKALQERREEEGYVPFDGPRIAAFSPEQEQAFAGVKAIQGASQPYFRTAEALTASSALAPSSASVGQFMNPYIQNVIDIQKREARRAGDVEQQRIGQKAVSQGAFGGSRQAILEAEANRNLQQRLGDIQFRGQAAAFEDAQNRLAQQRNRERSAGQQFATLGTTVPGQTLREISALETTGAQRRGVGQQALDIAQQEYEVARTFPERTLQDYQSIIRGYAAPIPASTVTRSTTQSQGASPFQQIGGLGLSALGTAGAFGAFKKEGGLVGLAHGGKIGKYNTASSIGNPNNTTSNFLLEFLTNAHPSLMNTRDAYFVKQQQEAIKRAEARERRAGMEVLGKQLTEFGGPASQYSDKDIRKMGRLSVPIKEGTNVSTVPTPQALARDVAVVPPPVPLNEAVRPPLPVVPATLKGKNPASDSDFMTREERIRENLYGDSGTTLGFDDIEVAEQVKESPQVRAPRPPILPIPSSQRQTNVPVLRPSNSPMKITPPSRPLIERADESLLTGSDKPDNIIGGADADQITKAIPIPGTIPSAVPDSVAAKPAPKTANDLQADVAEYLRLLKKKPSSDDKIKEAEEIRKQNLWASLANVGFRLMAQDKGQPMLTALGKAAEGSTKELAQINRDYQKALTSARDIDAKKLKDSIAMRTAADAAEADLALKRAKTLKEGVVSGKSVKGLTEDRLRAAVSDSASQLGTDIKRKSLRSDSGNFYSDFQIAMNKHILENEPTSVRAGQSSMAAAQLRFIRSNKGKEFIRNYNFDKKPPPPPGGESSNPEKTGKKNKSVYETLTNQGKS